MPGNISLRSPNYTKALSLRPDDIIVYHLRIGAYAELGDFENALNDCSKAIQLTPEDFVARSRRAMAYERMGQFAKAIEDWTWLSQGKRASETLAYRGFDYARLGDYKRAFEDLDRSVKEQPCATCYNIRGLVHVMRKQHSLAVVDFSKAIELAPDFFGAYANRADTYAKMNEKGKENADRIKASSLHSTPLFVFHDPRVTYANTADLPRGGSKECSLRLDEQDNCAESTVRTVEKAQGTVKGKSIAVVRFAFFGPGMAPRNDFGDVFRRLLLEKLQAKGIQTVPAEEYDARLSAHCKATQCTEYEKADLLRIASEAGGQTLLLGQAGVKGTGSEARIGQATLWLLDTESGKELARFELIKASLTPEEAVEKLGFLVVKRFEK